MLVASGLVDGLKNGLVEFDADEFVHSLVVPAIAKDNSKLLSSQRCV